MNIKQQTLSISSGLVFMLLMCSIIIAQEIPVVSGLVVDDRTREPLEGADAYLVKAQRGAAADSDGYFLIEGNFSGFDTLVVSYVGYQEYRVALRDHKPKKIVRLKAVNLEQKAVNIQADKIDLVKQEIPHAKDEISFEEIELRGSSELSDLIKTVSSVRIQGNDLSGRTIQIRGSDSDEVNVYVDGILINNVGLENAADLSIIPVESIEKIELLKGSNLALLGSGAFGGVVNITTRKNLKRGLYLKSKVGSFSTRYYMGEVNIPLSEKLIVNYFGQYNQFEPGINYWEDVPAEQRLTASVIETVKQNHNLSVNYYRGNSEISNRLFFYNLDYTTETFRNKRENYLVAGSFKGKLPLLNNIDLNVNYNRSDDGIEQFPVENAPGRIVNDFTSDRLAMRMVKKYSLTNENEFNILAEYVHDELDRATTEQRGDVTIDRYQAFLYENRWSAAGVAAFKNQLAGFKNITYDTHAGLRGDFIANGDIFVSPSIGGRFIVTYPDWELQPYGSFGRNIKIQTLLDNAYVRLQDVSQSDSSFVRLQPETNNAAELGLVYTYSPQDKIYRSFEASMAVFRNLIVNKLISRPGDVLTTQQQIGRNVTRGVEASVAFNQIRDLINLGASFNYLDVTDRLLYAYKPKTGTNVQMDIISGSGIYVTGVWFHEGESLALDNRRSPVTGEEEIASITIDPFYDVDVSVGYRFSVGQTKFNLQAAGYNLLDNSGYQDFLLKKRFVQLSLSARY
ncbi:MAG: TonB-dependent receptor [Calditrichia bacterium]